MTTATHTYFSKHPLYVMYGIIPDTKAFGIIELNTSDPKRRGKFLVRPMSTTNLPSGDTLSTQLSDNTHSLSLYGRNYTEEEFLPSSGTYDSSSPKITVMFLPAHDIEELNRYLVAFQPKLKSVFKIVDIHHHPYLDKDLRERINSAMESDYLASKSDPTDVFVNKDDPKPTKRGLKKSVGIVAAGSAVVGALAGGGYTAYSKMDKGKRDSIRSKLGLTVNNWETDREALAALDVS